MKIYVESRISDKPMMLPTSVPHQQTPLYKNTRHCVPKNAQITEMAIRHSILSFLLLLMAAPSHATGSVTGECSKTQYPSTCVQIFGQPGTVKAGEPLLESSMRISGQELWRCHATAVSLPDVHAPTPAERQAWNDCMELIQDALNDLNASAESAQSDTVSVYLSAAQTNLDTCASGFSDLNCPDSPFKTQMLGATGNASAIFSISLSFNAAVRSRRRLRRRRRRLLWHEIEVNDDDDDGFPQWVPRNTRRLLQSAPPAVAADAVVAADGSGTYTTIAAAVNAAPRGRSIRYVIHVKAGTYAENVLIPRELTNVLLLGNGIGKTVVTGSRSHGSGSTTFSSATVAASGSGFIAQSMTIRNTAGPDAEQAVALRVSADKAIVYDCSIEGFQDTLYAHSLRQFYRSSAISGTVDFICGNAAAVFQSCNILARRPVAGQTNTVTAQNRIDPNQDTGFVMHRCTVKAAEPLGAVKTFLGRPWHPYSRTVFMLSELGPLVDPAGWTPWNESVGTDRVYYGEYQNSGAGAGTAGRVKWKGFHVIGSAAEAAQFSVSRFVAGDSWLPSTGVPYQSGL